MVLGQKIDEVRMSLTRENYFDYGRDGDEIIVSNSSLSHINPDEGGSLKRFLNYIRGDAEKEESKSLERGTILHRFMEDKDSFTILPDDRPSEDVCKILLRVREDVIERGLVPSALEHHQDMIVQVARELNYGAKNWKSDTIIGKVREKGDAYFKFLGDSDGKVMTDRKTREILQGVTDGILSDEYTTTYYVENYPGTMKELPVLFHHGGFTCKALLDNVWIDFDDKIAVIRDIKSTSFPVNQYMGYRAHVIPDKLEFIAGGFQKYRVYRQLAFYTIALINWLLQNGFAGHEFTIGHQVLACETIEPYEHKVYPVIQQWIAAGFTEIDNCFKEIRGGQL